MSDSGIDREESVALLVRLQKELSEELSSILEFWSTSCIDQVNGGFIGSMDHFGQVDNEANKGCILNTRILWTFSAAYRIEADPEYKRIADRAFSYVTTYFLDPVRGGLFWEVDVNGKPINTKKQAYVQGFGIYAFSEYYRATGDQASLDLAKQLFYILEDNFWEPKFGGYLEALTKDWQELKDMRLSAKDLNSPKSMNTHLHLLEPYTNLYRVWPEPQLKAAIESLLHIFTEKIFNPGTKHLKLFFDLDWNSQFEEISFGHDIEGAWLMNEASMIIGDGEPEESVHQVTKVLVEATLHEGLDSDGSLFYELKGREMDTDKHWWPQAEAMVGFMDAYELEGNDLYLDKVVDLWQFIRQHLIDNKNGEWYWRVDNHNKPNEHEVKAGFWKGPYHSGRALMELIERIDKIKEG